MEHHVNQWPRDIKRAACLENVVDVTLVGTSSFDYWIEQLRPEGLHPVETDGHARILIIAAEGRFFGQTFQELSISVLARPFESPDSSQGALLLGAFNSNRFFAFCERTFFGAPYRYAAVSVSSRKPIGFSVGVPNRDRIHAALSSKIKLPDRQLDSWRGTVYLPGSGPKRAGTKAFWASIEGATNIRPYGDNDEFEFETSDQSSVLHHLKRSKFKPLEWRIRPSATHEKSKTYARVRLA